jgi:hypothetical protein
LEWIPRTWRTFRQAAITCFVILVGFITFRDWGIGWIADWKAWLLVVVLSGLAGLGTWASDDMEAGADWFSYGKSWVRTYELTEVKLDKAWAVDRLELTDADGREISIKIIDIQNNPDLWNLVYNGILHSVHEGGAAVNERARQRLRLDLADRLPFGDDVA